MTDKAHNTTRFSRHINARRPELILFVLVVLLPFIPIGQIYFSPTEEGLLEWHPTYILDQPFFNLLYGLQFIACTLLLLPWKKTRRKAILVIGLIISMLHSILGLMSIVLPNQDYIPDTGNFLMVSFGAVMLIIFFKKTLFKFVEKDKEIQHKRKREDLDSWSGTVTIVDDKIKYTKKGRELNSVRLKDIKVVGEVTFDAHLATDWFLVLVCGSKPEETHYVSQYAINAKEVHHAIEQKFNSEMTSELFHKTSNASSVIFPKSLATQQLFQYNDVDPNGLWEKIGTSLRLGSPVEVELSTSVIEYLKNEGQKPHPG